MNDEFINAVAKLMPKKQKQIVYLAANARQNVEIRYT